MPRLVLHPDRLFPADPATRAIARELYALVAKAPIISPHGHTDPEWFATDAPWAMLFPNAPDAGTVPRHPSQLYEAGLEGIVLFIFLRILTHRYHKLATRGFISGAFAFGYGIARTAAELFREPDIQLGYFDYGLTMGMLLSIPMIFAGLAMMIWVSRRARTAGAAGE